MNFNPFSCRCASGAYLSGGKDSSAIVGLATQGIKEDQFHKLTSNYPGHRVDEARYAEEVAESNKAPWIIWM